MQKFVIKTFTARYIAQEDRIRLDCVEETGRALGIWFTRRLIDRVIPTFAKQITVASKQQMAAEIEHEVLQSAAKQERILAQETPPVLLKESAPHILCNTVQFRKDANGASTIVFTDTKTLEAQMVLNNNQLRVMLDIFYDMYGKAEWSREQFPTWLVETVPFVDPNVKVH